MQKTTYFETLMHLTKGMMGAGIFSMGIGFKNAGLIVALVASPIVMGLVMYCVHSLVDAIEVATKYQEKENRISKNSDDDEYGLNYCNVVKLIFIRSERKCLIKTSDLAYALVNLGICIMYMGFCTLYVVFVARNITEVLHSHDIKLTNDDDQAINMMIFTVPMWMLTMIPNLKRLSPISSVANVLLLTSFGISYYYMFSELLEADRPPLTDHISYVGEWEQIPLFFGVALFSFEMVALIFPLKHEMQNPAQLTSKAGVLNVGFTIVAFFITFMGAISYLTYGNALDDTVLANFPQEGLSTAVKVIVSVLVTLTYPLQLYVPIRITWAIINKRFGPFKNPILMQSLQRTFLVLITLAVGESIPFIDLLISLIGSLCSTTITLLLPPLLHVIIYYGDQKSAGQKAKMIIGQGIIMIIAAVICISGLISTVRDIIRKYE